MKKRTDKQGLPAGSLVHVGDFTAVNTPITVMQFDAESFQEQTLNSWDEYNPSGSRGITWIDVCGVNNPEVIKKIGAAFKLHPLSLEDIMNTDHITKLNHIGDYVLVIMKSFVTDDPSDDELQSRQISIVISNNYVISFQEASCNIFESVRKNLRVNMAQFHKLGAAYLAFCLMDFIVDNYFESLERIDDGIFLLEEATTDAHTNESLKQIQTLRRQTIAVRRAAWPLREVINSLSKREAAHISEASSIYFSDLYDHIVQILDITESFREILSNIFDIHLANISNKVNEIMKVLTMMATVVMPLTLIVGLYGMNFDYMPELKWHWGYPSVICAMILIIISMVAFFKRKKWL